MQIKPKANSRGVVVNERILLMGSAGTGKTYDWLTIARACPESQFYVVDTDLAVDRMLMGEFGALENVHVETALEWPDYLSAMTKYTELVKPGDWIVFDLLSPAWEAVQDYYVGEVYKDDGADYFLAKRVEMAEKNKGGAPTTFAQYDWTYINKLYRKLANAIFRAQCHVLATAELQSIYGDDEEARAMFGSLGVRPAGQKHTAHLFHTVLVKQKSRQGSYRMLTMKDRERKEQQGTDVTDFARDYLMVVGGWRPSES